MFVIFCDFENILKEEYKENFKIWDKIIIWISLNLIWILFVLNWVKDSDFKKRNVNVWKVCK